MTERMQIGSSVGARQDATMAAGRTPLRWHVPANGALALPTSPHFKGRLTADVASAGTAPATSESIFNTPYLDERRRRFESSTAVSLVSQQTIDRLAEYYVFGSDRQVGEFLRRHPHVTNLLIEAQRFISRYFGGDGSTLLETFSDPDSRGHEELFARIRTSLPPEEALERLRQFDHGWWIMKSPDACGLLNFDVAPDH